MVICCAFRLKFGIPREREAVAWLALVSRVTSSERRSGLDQSYAQSKRLVGRCERISHEVSGAEVKANSFVLLESFELFVRTVNINSYRIKIVRGKKEACIKRRWRQEQAVRKADTVRGHAPPSYLYIRRFHNLLMYTFVYVSNDLV